MMYDDWDYDEFDPDDEDERAPEEPPDFPEYEPDDEDVWRGYGDEIVDQLKGMGFSSPEDIVVDMDWLIENNQVGNLRGQVFDSLEEAIYWLHDIGVMVFSRVYYNRELDKYQDAVGDSR
jgi:hypothetical protein